MSNALDNFVNSLPMNSGARGVMKLELLTGCARCGRRLVGSNNLGSYVREGTSVLLVHDEKTGEPFGAYGVCDRCN